MNGTAAGCGETFRNPSETIEKARLLVDSEVGIIRFVQEAPISPTDPRLFHMFALTADTRPLAAGLGCSRNNAGASPNRERAIAAAIGEAVERYCSAIYTEESLVLASYREVEAEAVDPRSFPLGSEAEYQQPDCPVSRFSPDLPIRWVQGHVLGQGRSILVPACMVYMPYRFMNRAEYIFIPISTGLACGNTREEAILTGMYEVVERDAFTAVWLNRIPVPGLDVSSAHDETIHFLVSEYTRTGERLYLRDITTDVGIPTVLAILRDETGGSTTFAVAAAARLHPEQAVVKSLEELALTRRGVTPFWWTVKG